jgi:acetyl-CoA acetyltransferase
MKRTVVVAGVGMIPFAKPGASATYPAMGASAARAALDDAGVAYSQVEQAYVGYVYGDSTAGQRTLYEVGMTGVPVVNVNNNCATGSTALFLARQAVESGAAECALALGFEQMAPGAIGTHFNDRPTPFDRFRAEAEASSACPTFHSRFATSAARAWRTCSATAPRSAPSRRYGRRRAGTRRAIRLRSCATR